MCVHLGLHVKCPTFLIDFKQIWIRLTHFNPLNAELNPICHLLALSGGHHILHVRGIRVNRTVQQKTSRKSVQRKPSLYMRTGMTKLKRRFSRFCDYDQKTANYFIHILSLFNVITYSYAAIH
jgi:hypothetical protein